MRFRRDCASQSPPLYTRSIHWPADALGNALERVEHLAVGERVADDHEIDIAAGPIRCFRDGPVDERHANR
jgi:hypothetical protein